MKHPLSTMLLFSAIFSTLLLIGCGINDHKDLSKIDPDFVLSTQELLDAYEENEDAANNQFLGKVIQWEGVIKDIAVSEEGTTLYFGIEDYIGGIAAEMDSSKLTDEPNVGDRVVVRGICSGKLIDVVVSRCILIK